MLAFGTAVAPPAQAHYHPTLHAPNVWTLPLSENSVRTASRVFADAILPHLESGIISNLETTRLPCTALQSSEHGRYFVMRAGSSTNERLRDSSDLSWISVDDRQAWDVFSDLFWSSGVAEAMAPFIDVDKGVQLYSSFFVVRSRCAAANYHTDWADGCGTNAFTLLAPLDDYPTSDFHLLYKCGGGSEKGLKQYRYRRGEAIVFTPASRVVHSAEGGRFRRCGRRRPTLRAALFFLSQVLVGGTAVAHDDCTSAARYFLQQACAAREPRTNACVRATQRVLTCCL